ncbi:MAG: MiaB/RimO family radical SAM methylthiotransferase, partial [Flavobacteriales bacterium]
EIILLGQNVNAYDNEGYRLSDLILNIEKISEIKRVRYTTSHPKDMHDDVLFAMAKYHNICSYIHLPVQSGSTRLLELMNRGYSREWYFERMDRIMEIVPDCGLSTDIITGFCTETEEDHQDTLSLMERVGYDFAYMFKYSERPGTAAAKKMEDDIPEEIKQRRLAEVIEIQSANSLKSNKKDLGKVHEVLVEGTSKKSDEMLQGRNPQNKVVVFPKGNYKKGDYVNVMVDNCTSATLLGNAVN